MDGYLADRVNAGRKEARRADALKRGRIRVVVGDQTYPVLEIGAHGFTIAADEPPSIRGFVDLFDGPRRLGRQLVVLASHRDGEARFEYKLQSAEGETPADYVREGEKIAGVLTGPPKGL